MTKHTLNEAALKCHLTVEEPQNPVEDNSLVVCDAQVRPELASKPGVNPMSTGIKSKKSGLGKIMPELYNLEECADSAKLVKIDLDLNLYQMEKV